MNKTDLINEITDDTRLKKETVKAVINSMIKIVKQKLLFGIDVDIRDFVKFKRVVAPASKKMDFKTGKQFIAPKRWRLKVDAPATLKAQIAKKPIYDSQG